MEKSHEYRFSCQKEILSNPQNLKRFEIEKCSCASYKCVIEKYSCALYKILFNFLGLLGEYIKNHSHGNCFLYNPDKKQKEKKECFYFYEIYFVGAN